MMQDTVLIPLCGHLEDMLRYMPCTRPPEIIASSGGMSLSSPWRNCHSMINTCVSPMKQTVEYSCNL